MQLFTKLRGFTKRTGATFLFTNIQPYSTQTPHSKIQDSSTTDLHIVSQFIDYSIHCRYGRLNHFKFNMASNDEVPSFELDLVHSFEGCYSNKSALEQTMWRLGDAKEMIAEEGFW